MHTRQCGLALDSVSWQRISYRIDDALGEIDPVAFLARDLAENIRFPQPIDVLLGGPWRHVEQIAHAACGYVGLFEEVVEESQQ